MPNLLKLDEIASAACYYWRFYRFPHGRIYYEMEIVTAARGQWRDSFGRWQTDGERMLFLPVAPHGVTEIEGREVR